MTKRQAARDTAEAALREGLRLYDLDDVLGAHAQFGEAYKRAPQLPRVVSWYGLTLVLVERNSNLGVALCDQAVKTAGPEPELLLNQARVHLALGQRERAVRALSRGIVAHPEAAQLRAALQELGTRQRPVIPFLPRSNPLNKLLGRLRYQARGGKGGGPVGPAALGRRGPGAGGGHA